MYIHRYIYIFNCTYIYIYIYHAHTYNITTIYKYMSMLCVITHDCQEPMRWTMSTGARWLPTIP